MSEPNGSFNFTAQMLASEPCGVGNGLVYDSNLGVWRVSTAANRATANARTQAIAKTAYGGSMVGKVQYQMSGVLAAEISGLGAGAASWVRMSTAGICERFTPAGGGLSDIIGKCFADGRVALDMGVWTEDMAVGGGGGTTPTLTAGLDISVGTAPNYNVAFTGTLPTVVAGTGISVSGGPNYTVTATGGGATSPGGSPPQGQFNIAGAFAGFTSFFWDATNTCASVLTRFGFLNGASVGAVNWNPTATRNMAIPDVSGTFCEIAAAQTLTTKTIVLASNTLTDTGAVAGGMPVHNGTSYVNQAKGANSTVWTTGAGGAVAWAQVSLTAMVTGILPIANGGTNNGSAMTTNAALQFDGTRISTFVGLTTDGTNALFASSLKIGAGTRSTVGVIQVGNTSQDVMTVENLAASDYIPIISTDISSNAVHYGINVAATKAASHTHVGAVNDVAIGTTASFGLLVTTTDIEYSLPRHGNSTPYSSDGEVTIIGAGVTLSAAQYSRTQHKYTTTANGTFVYPVPADQDHSYTKVIECVSTSSATPITLSIGSGTTFAFGTSGVRGGVFKFTPTGVFKQATE